MDLTGVEPVSKIHTLYNCLRCFIWINHSKGFSVPPVSRFWTSIATTNILLSFGCGIKPPFDIQNCCLFLIGGDYVTNRAQLYISKPCRNLFKPKKGGRLPPRPQGNNQVSSFNLTHLARVAQIVLEYLTALPPLCEVSLLGVPRYTALFSYWLLMLAYWLLVDTGGFEPHPFLIQF